MTEVCDLLLIAHVDCQSNCAASLPLSRGVLPRVIVQIGGGALVARKNLDQVPEINRSSGRSLGYRNTPNRVSAFELTGGIDDDLSLAGLEFAARRNNVASAQDLRERRWLQSVLG